MKPWRRKYRVREERLPSRPLLPLRSTDRGPDAPYDRRDARFWGIVAVCILVPIAIAAIAVVVVGT